MTRPGTATRRPTAGFRCDECGTSSVRWLGRCPECQAWGTMTEAGPAAMALITARPGPVRTGARPISEPGADVARARPTGVAELDRVLGGGLVPGSVVLLAGEPGVGKSTVLLEVARSFAATSGTRALIITGEESAAQVRLRAARTAALDPALYLAAENDLGAILTHIEDVDPGLLVVDSIQTVTTAGVDSGAGSVTQIRAATASLISVAKARGMATVLVGHVTKDGSIAGPRLLEHLVDVVLQFDGDRHSSLRLMREDGVVGLADPSGLFLARRDSAVAGTCVTVTIEGRRPLLTEVQSLVTPTGHGGSPRRSVTDLDASRVAMVLAILTRHGGLRLADQEVYAASVGGLRVTEPAADLAVALAVASACTGRPVSAAVCAVGELSLSGDVRRVGDLPRRLNEAVRLGFRVALVPAAADPVSIRGLHVVPVATVAQAMSMLERDLPSTSGP